MSAKCRSFEAPPMLLFFFDLFLFRSCGRGANVIEGRDCGAANLVASGLEDICGRLRNSSRSIVPELSWRQASLSVFDCIQARGLYPPSPQISLGTHVNVPYQVS